jgi:hypothetical protein
MPYACKSNYLEGSEKVAQNTLAQMCGQKTKFAIFA